MGQTSVKRPSEQAMSGKSLSDLPCAKSAYCVVTKFLPLGPSRAYGLPSVISRGYHVRRANKTETVKRTFDQAHPVVVLPRLWVLADVHPDITASNSFFESWIEAHLTEPEATDASTLKVMQVCRWVILCR
jgi:hypothetical protein